MTFEDGNYDYIEIKDHFNNANHFKNEKELCNYIENNIDNFCNELGIDYKSHTRECRMRKFRAFGASMPRIDFLINENDGGIILLEVKNPSQTQSEITRCVAQMLDYYITAEECGHKINKAIILTTKVNDNFMKIINRFNLPVELVLFSKGCLAVWQKEAS